MNLDVFYLIISIIATWFFARYYFTRKKKWNEKIQELESHLEYVRKVKKSSIEMNRQAFRTIFIILFCISSGLLVSSFSEHLSFSLKVEFLPAVVVSLKFIFFLGATVVSFLEFIIFNDIIHYQKAEKRISMKLEKLKNKVENV